MLAKATWLLLLSPFLLYGGLCYMIYSGQREMMYFPTRESISALADDFMLDNDGEQLKIWHRPGSNGKAILYFGGNAEDVVANVGNFRTVFPDHALFLMNYRGFGGSSGEPSEGAIFADAEALFDHANEEYGQVSVIGRSLGSGVAAHLAAERNVDKLVLVTPFDSIENIAKDRFAIFPISLLLLDKYDALSKVSSIVSPVLAIIAEDDEVVPYQRSIGLVSAFDAGQIETIIVRGASHNSIGVTPEYLRALYDFLGR